KWAWNRFLAGYFLVRLSQQ
ncbi:tryptophan/tyrosine permease family protein, partial [Vibrio parahaemolyticus AQ3810]